MKIAILTSSFLPAVGGAEVFAHNVSRQLVEFGNTVHVYVPIEYFRQLEPRFQVNLKALPKSFFGAVRRIPFLGLLRAQRYLLSRQREEDYDAWLAVRTFPTGYAAICLTPKVPLVIRASGEDIQKSPHLEYGVRLDRANEARIERAVRSCDRVVAMTESARREFLNLGVHNDAIASIPNAVDVERFTPNREVSEIRTALSWPNDRPIILTTGRNHPKKGFSLIPQVAERLREQGLHFMWYVVGMGVENLDVEIRRRRLEDCISTLGQVGINAGSESDGRFPADRLVSMYQAADIYAFPSLLENFAMVIPEAMASQSAVVSTNAPGCRELIIHGETGLQAQAGDPEDFAIQLSRVLSDERLRAGLSRKAHRAVEAWSWPNVAREYEMLFESVIEARTHNSPQHLHHDA